MNAKVERVQGKKLFVEVGYFNLVPELQRMHKIQIKARNNSLYHIIEI